MYTAPNARRYTAPNARRYSPLPKSPVDLTGRVDVLVLRLLMRGLENYERRNPALAGLSNQLRPLVEGIVFEVLPARRMFRGRVC